jgi:transposase
VKRYNKALQKIFCFVGYIFCCISVESKQATITLKRTKKVCKCPICERRCSVIETYTRTIRDLDICGKRCYLSIETCHIKCPCGYYGIEKLDFLDKYGRYTKRFEKYVAMLCEKMSLKDVAEVAGINWKTAKRIDKQALQKYVKDLKKAKSVKIGIDEIAYEKGHKYLTIVRDLDGGVIWVKEGRKKEVLDLFFKELGVKKCKKIKVAVIDMWDPYIASIKENTKAEIVFDKFHVAKKINEVIDIIRKKEFAQADVEERKLMKHKRFLILARQKNLKPEEVETLNTLIQQNNTLYVAYLMKEQGLDVFDEDNSISGIARLQKWIDNVIKTGIKEFEKVIGTIKNYFYGIINYFKYQITNAASEGFNTKITVIKRRAYGFRDLEYFKLKILQSCG